MQLNQAQRQRAIELIDEKVKERSIKIEKMSAKEFIRKNRESAFAQLSLNALLDTINDSITNWHGYNSNSTIDLLEFCKLDKKYEDYIRDCDNAQTLANEKLVKYASLLKDEVMFGKEMSIVHEALAKLDNYKGE